MKTASHRFHRWALSVGVAWVLILLLAGALPGFAQTAEGEPRDLEIEFINVTTGEGAVVDRISIDYVTARNNNVVNIKPDDSTFTLYSVPIKTIGKYIVTAWYDDVPYWWSRRGGELLKRPVTLHVFDAVSDLKDVTLTGLDLVIRHQESLVRLEYMLQINNAAIPQVTVVGQPATFELALPAGASGISAHYTRGPEPVRVEIESPGLHTGLVLPLTPGPNNIRLRAVVAWSEGLEIPVGSNIPIKTWSVLGSPEWMEIASTDMELNDGKKVPGYSRFKGFPLEADQTVNLRLNSGQQVAAPEEDLFAKEAPAEQEDSKPAEKIEKGGGMSLPLIIMGVLIIVIIVATVRRRS